METADPITEIDAIVKPWLWGDWRISFPSFGGPPLGPFSFDGHVRAGLGPADAGTSAREVRAWMLNAAEDAIAAVEAAGWHLASYPSMEFSGQLHLACVTTTGDTVTPAQQHSIALRVRFEVIAPR